MPRPAGRGGIAGGSGGGTSAGREGRGAMRWGLAGALLKKDGGRATAGQATTTAAPSPRAAMAPIV